MSVNIYNPQAITEWLNKQAQEDAEVAVWLKAALTRFILKREQNTVPLNKLPQDAPAWLENKWDTCGSFHEFKPDAELTDQIRHIADWFISAKTNRERFLEDKNEKGVPNIFMSITSLEDAYDRADNYLNNYETIAIEVEGDTKTIMDFGDGNKIVQLLTPNALRYEGPSMHHCIGKGGYDDVLNDGNTVFYSLRDKNNKPHATFHVETEGNALIQCKGKNNQPPIQKYMTYVQKFVTSKKFKLKESARHTGLIQDKHGAYHSIYNLPEGLEVEGDLDLAKTNITTLPKCFKVGGDLYLDGCTGLTALPNDLKVGGNLYLGGCTGLTVLPNDLKVGGDLYLDGCTGLKSIPRSITCTNMIFTDLGSFRTVTEAADAFEKKYGKQPETKTQKKNKSVIPAKAGI